MDRSECLAASYRLRSSSSLAVSARTCSALLSLFEDDIFSASLLFLSEQSLLCDAVLKLLVVVVNKVITLYWWLGKNEYDVNNFSCFVVVANSMFALCTFSSFVHFHIILALMDQLF